MANWRDADGYSFSLLSLLIGFILGAVVAWLGNSVIQLSTQVEQDWSSTQSYLNAISGLQLKMGQVREDNLDSYKSSNFIVDVDVTSPYHYSMVSTGVAGSSTRMVGLDFFLDRSDMDLFDRNNGVNYTDTTGLGDDFSVDPLGFVEWWVTDDTSFFNHDILTNKYNAIFITGGPGGHLKNGLTLEIPKRDCICQKVMIDLSASRDATSMYGYTSDDYIRILANGHVLEEFRGESKTVKGPLVPTIDLHQPDISHHFQEFYFDITHLDSLQLTVEFKLDENLYLGLDRIRVDGEVFNGPVWSFTGGSLKEL